MEFFLNKLPIFLFPDQFCQLDSRDMNSRNRWSPCKIPCKRDDDCINYGRHICCPALPGSSCDGECLLADIKADSSNKSKCVLTRFSSREQVVLLWPYTSEVKVPQSSNT